jgi:hypothetical protein
VPVFARQHDPGPALDGGTAGARLGAGGYSGPAIHPLAPACSAAYYRLSLAWWSRTAHAQPWRWRDPSRWGTPFDPTRPASAVAEAQAAAWWVATRREAWRRRRRNWETMLLNREVVKVAVVSRSAGPCPLLDGGWKFSSGNDIRVMCSARRTASRAIIRGSCSPPDYVSTAKVFDMLMAVPKFGRVKAARLLNQCRISQSKTVGGLSERQRAELVNLFNSR